MLKVYEVQTAHEGRYDLFNVCGDVLEVDETQIRIYRVGDEGKYLVAAFQHWNYGIELPEGHKKPPE